MPDTLETLEHELAAYWDQKKAKALDYIVHVLPKKGDDYDCWPSTEQSAWSLFRTKCTNGENLIVTLEACKPDNGDTVYTARYEAWEA